MSWRFSRQAKNEQPSMRGLIKIFPPVTVSIPDMPCIKMGIGGLDLL
jgi:hypothetical protein